MKRTLPSWFEADQVFEQDEGWFFGSRLALHVGPYRDYAMARVKSIEATDQLLRLRSESARLKYARQLLQEEWEVVGPFGEATVIGEEIELGPPPIQVRSGELQRSWIRSERFFQMNGVWFFSTREGIDVGPFDSEAEAKKHERNLVAELTRTRSSEEAHRAIYAYKHRAHLETLDEARIQTVGLRQFSRRI